MSQLEEPKGVEYLSRRLERTKETIRQKRTLKRDVSFLEIDVRELEEVIAILRLRERAAASQGETP